jgi:heme a synthase
MTFSEVQKSTRLLARFAWITLACNVAVIVWGAFVRATGSGAGCGEHWPLCNGTLVPRSPQAQTIIEFVHRITSGLVLVTVSSLTVWCWRRTSKGDCSRYSALMALVLVLNEAFLGALLVVFNKVAQDTSAARAVLLSLHFANTLLLLASLALTALWLSNGTRRLAINRDRRDVIVIAVGLLAALFMGVTGALAALGDTIFPATSLGSSLAQDFSSQSPFLLRLRMLHPALAITGGIYVLWAVLKTQAKRTPSSWLLPALIMVLMIQFVIGAVNVMLLAPVGVQLLHLLVADLFWIVLVLVSANLLFETVNSQPTKRRVPDSGGLETDWLRELS